jgi:hypothetical protein
MKRPLDLTAFGLETDLDEDEIIQDVVVLIRSVNPDCGHDSIYLACSPGVSWLVQLGMVTAGQAILKGGIYRDAES